MNGFISIVVVHRVPVTAKITKNIDGDEEYGDFKLSKSKITRITKDDIIKCFDNTNEDEMNDTFIDKDYQDLSGIIEKEAN